MDDGDQAVQARLAQRAPIGRRVPRDGHLAGPRRAPRSPSATRKRAPISRLAAAIPPGGRQAALPPPRSRR